MGRHHELAAVMDAFQTAKWAATPPKSPRPLPASGTLRLTRDTSGNHPISFDVTMCDDSGHRSVADRLWRNVADALWSPLCRARRRLFSEETIRRWTYDELTRLRTSEGMAQTRAGPGTTSDVLQVWDALWPLAARDGLPSARSFQEIEFDSLVHEQAFNAWIDCPHLEGPFQAARLNRRKTRIHDGQLFLVFDFKGAEFEFRLHGRTRGENIDSHRSARDLARLYRVATDRKAGYRNLAELVTSFLTATVAEEAGPLLEAQVDRLVEISQYAPCRDGTPPSPAQSRDAFLVQRRNGKLFPVAERAVRDAVAQCVRDCCAFATEQATKVKHIANTARSTKEVGLAMDALEAIIPALLRQYRAEHCRRQPVSALLADAADQQFALSAAEAESIQAGKVPPGVGLIVYEQPPTIWQRMWAALRGKTPARRVAAIAIKATSDQGLVFPRSNGAHGTNGASFWRALGITREPATYRQLIESLAESPFDREWRGRANTLVAELVESHLKDVSGPEPAPRSAIERLIALLGAVRFGKSTIADLCHGIEACNAPYGGVGSTGASADVSTLGTSASPAGTRVNASSSQDALCKVLFERVKGQEPRFGSIAEIEASLWVDYHWIDYADRDSDGRIRPEHALYVPRNASETRATMPSAAQTRAPQEWQTGRVVRFAESPAAVAAFADWAGLRPDAAESIMAKLYDLFHALAMVHKANALANGEPAKDADKDRPSAVRQLAIAYGTLLSALTRHGDTAIRRWLRNVMQDHWARWTGEPGTDDDVIRQALSDVPHCLAVFERAWRHAAGSESGRSIAQPSATTTPSS